MIQSSLNMEDQILDEVLDLMSSPDHIPGLDPAPPISAITNECLVCSGGFTCDMEMKRHFEEYHSDTSVTLGTNEQHLQAIESLISSPSLSSSQIGQPELSEIGQSELSQIGQSELSQIGQSEPRQSSDLSPAFFEEYPPLDEEVGGEDQSNEHGPDDWLSHLEKIPATNAKGDQRRKPKFACGICEKQYANKSDVQNHINSLHFNLKNNVKCPECGLDFANRGSLYKHRKKYHSQSSNAKPPEKEVELKNRKTSKSAKTNATSSDWEKYLEELPGQDGTQIFCCGICQDINDSREDVKSHIESVHFARNIGENESSASSGANNAKPQVNYKDYAEFVEEDSAWKCTICDKIVKHKGYLRIHILELHFSIKVRPERKPNNNSRNTDIVKEEKKVLADETEKRGQQDVNYQDYVEAVDEEGGKTSYKCSKCDKTVKFKFNLKSHILKHFGITLTPKKRKGSNEQEHVETADKSEEEEKREFGCTECPGRFKNITGLKLHMQRMHSAPVGADLKIKRENHNSSEDVLECPECLEEFAVESKLNLHLRDMHSQTVEYKCSQCKRQFALAQRLITHYKLEHMKEEDFYEMDFEDDAGPVTDDIVKIEKDEKPDIKKEEESVLEIKSENEMATGVKKEEGNEETSVVPKEEVKHEEETIVPKEEVKKEEQEDVVVPKEEVKEEEGVTDNAKGGVNTESDDDDLEIIEEIQGKKSVHEEKKKKTIPDPQQRQKRNLSKASSVNKDDESPLGTKKRSRKPSRKALESRQESEEEIKMQEEKPKQPKRRRMTPPQPAKAVEAIAHDSESSEEEDGARPRRRKAARKAAKKIDEEFITDFRTESEQSDDYEKPKRKPPPVRQRQMPKKQREKEEKVFSEDSDIEVIPVSQVRSAIKPSSRGRTPRVKKVDEEFVADLESEPEESEEISEDEFNSEGVEESEDDFDLNQSPPRKKIQQKTPPKKPVVDLMMDYDDLEADIMPAMVIPSAKGAQVQ